MRLFETDTPAAVQSAESLDALAVQINAEYAVAEQGQRQALAAYRKVGQALVKAKGQCRHGEWLTWLKAHVPFSERHARRYMALAKSDVTSDLESAWNTILGNNEPVAVPASEICDPEPEPEPDDEGDEREGKSDVTSDLEPGPVPEVPPQPELPTSPVAADAIALIEADRETAEAIVKCLKEAQEALDAFLRRRGGELLRRVTLAANPLFELKPVRADKSRVREKWVCRGLSAVLQAVKRTRPVKVCAGCMGRPGGCSGCRGSGFVPFDADLLKSDAQLVFDFGAPWEDEE